MRFYKREPRTENDPPVIIIEGADWAMKDAANKVAEGVDEHLRFDEHIREKFPAILAARFKFTHVYVDGNDDIVCVLL